VLKGSKKGSKKGHFWPSSNKKVGSKKKFHREKPVFWPFFSTPFPLPRSRVSEKIFLMDNSGKKAIFF
jgi:hypothetical protein